MPEEMVPVGTWVAVEQTVLAPGERAPGIPAETAAVPLLARIKGFLVQAGAPGTEVLIRTAIGREVRGVLREVNPAYTHGFGSVVPELIRIGEEARAKIPGATGTAEGRE